MRDAHEELAALAPAYALDALDPAEREVFEAHLGHCLPCRSAVREFSAVGAAIGYSAPVAAPRPELRQRVLDAVRATVVPPAERGRVRPLVFAWGAAAALLAVTVGLAAYVVSLNDRIADLQAQLTEATSRRLLADRAVIEARRISVETRASLDVLVAPDLARIDLAGQPAAPSARARALWSRQRGMVIFASNLPALPPGRTYQVWVVTARDRVSAGVAAPDTTGRMSGVFATPRDIDPPVAVAVTIEPAGGVAQPTGAFYLLGAVKS